MKFLLYKWKGSKIVTPKCLFKNVDYFKLKRIKGQKPRKKFDLLSNYVRSFPDSSVGKESAFNAVDPCSIPGLGRSNGEGRGYLHQYSWAFLAAQLVKNLPAMQET